MQNYKFMKDQTITLQPLTIGWGCDYSANPVMAAEAWQFGVKKPRQALRDNEIPTVDVSLDNLSNVYPWVKVLPAITVRDTAHARQLVGSCGDDIDAYVVKSSTTEEAGAILAALAKKDIPILPMWDNWGFSWYGSYLTEWCRELQIPSYMPIGAQDVETILRAVRAISRLRCTKILYIGDIPSHSCNAVTRPADLYKKFRVDFHQIGFGEYIDAVEKYKNTDAAAVLAKEWASKYTLCDEIDTKLVKYTAIELALRELLEKYDANALTVDCAFLPDIEYVSCVAASKLIDDGCTFGCEGDVCQVLALQLLVGISGQAGLMGNLFENAIHQDILDNTIVINHDVMPESMACKDCPMQLRDFHDSRKGATFFNQMPEGAVTMGGLSFDGTSLWVSEGALKWVEDTVHCRISIGIDVKDAKTLMRGRVGHHQTMVYGSYADALRLAGQWLGLTVKTL